MRSAKWLTSAIVEPPKPRLITGRSGKASAVCQKRMVELPTKRMQCGGTAFWWSHFSNAAISDSKRAEPVGIFATERAAGVDASFASATEFVGHEKAQKSTKREIVRDANDAVFTLTFIVTGFTQRRRGHSGKNPRPTLKMQSLLLQIPLRSLRLSVKSI